MAEEAKLSDNAGKDVKVGETGKKDVKKGKGFVQKYKWYILGGVVLIGVIVVWWVNRKGAGGSGSQDAGSQASVDPSTGYLNGSPADLAAQGASGVSAAAPGLDGPPGPAGPQGPAGRVSLYAIAKRILEGRGILNPTHNQIMNVRNTLEHIGTRPVTHNPPVTHKPTPVRKPVKAGGK